MIKEDLLKIEDILLYYKAIEVNKESGDPALVFLHDALGSTAQWKDFPERLAEETGLNAFIFDRQGYGRSAPATRLRTKDYLHEEALDTLPAFLEKLRIERPVLFGHSDGGTIALLYAARFEPRAIICEAAHVLVEEVTLKGIRQAASERGLLIGKLKKYHGAKAARLFDEWQRVWLAEDFRDWNIESQLGQINCPALIMQGGRDEYATREHLERIAGGIGPNAHAETIENCGHIPHLEAKEEVLEKTAEFLKFNKLQFVVSTPPEKSI